jgi:hypothetical protein
METAGTLRVSFDYSHLPADKLPKIYLIDSVAIFRNGFEN